MKNKIMFVVALIGALVIGYLKYSNSSIGLNTIKALKSGKDIEKILSSDDLKIYLGSKKYKQYLDIKTADFLKNYNDSDKLVIEEKVLSNALKVAKITNTINNNQLQLSFQLEKKDWKVVLDLLKYKEIADLHEQINSLESDLSEENLAILVDSYQLLQNLEKINYDEKIKNYASILERMRSSRIALTKISFKVIEKKKNGLILGEIINESDKDITKLLGKMSVLNDKGDVLFNQDVNLYEVIPNNFVYGEKIKAGFKKKVGLQLDSSIKISDKDFVTVEIKSFE